MLDEISFCNNGFITITITIKTCTCSAPPINTPMAHDKRRENDVQCSELRIVCNVIQNCLKLTFESVWATHKFKGCWQAVPGQWCSDGESSLAKLQTGSRNNIVTTSVGTKSGLWWNISISGLHLVSVVPTQPYAFKTSVSVKCVDYECVAFTSAAMSEWIAPERRSSSPVTL